MPRPIEHHHHNEGDLCRQFETKLRTGSSGMMREERMVTGGRSTQKKRSSKRPPASVPFSKFKHTAIDSCPEKAKDFFEACKEVATYQNKRLFFNDGKVKPIYPCLQMFAAVIAGNKNPEFKRPYLGCDLYEGHEAYKPLTSSELDSSCCCLEYIQTVEERKISDYGKGKITIVSPRHHIVDLIMALYHDSEVSIICTKLGRGKLLFSEDKSVAKENGLHSKNPITRKICFSGFALEDKLTTSHDGKSGHFYSIVEAKLNDRINLLLRCEMDAYNPITETYTELKCFAKLNVQENAHRRKLLKTWIQIGLIPNSDLIIGLRDTQVGQLEDLIWYSKDSLYRRITNTSIRRSDRYFNFNANVAVEWSYHCIESICDLIIDNSDTPIDDANQELESFRILIDKSHNIQVKKLRSVPKHVQIPKRFG